MGRRGQERLRSGRICDELLLASPILTRLGEEVAKNGHVLSQKEIDGLFPLEEAIDERFQTLREMIRREPELLDTLDTFIETNKK